MYIGDKKTNAERVFFSRKIDKKYLREKHLWQKIRNDFPYYNILYFGAHYVQVNSKFSINFIFLEIWYLKL